MSNIDQTAASRIVKQSIEIGKTEAAFRQTESSNRLEAEEQEGFNPNASANIKKREVNNRPLTERRKASEGEAARVEKVENEAEGEDLADNYYRRNYELEKDKLRDLAVTLRNATQFEDVLTKVLGEFENDPTLADEALEYLEQVVGGNAKKVISDARNYLNTVKKREIEAGRNIDVAAKSYHAAGLGASPSELRNLYREITQEPKDHNILFDELAMRYSFEELKKVTAFLFKSMDYDLKKGPSIQRQELMRIMTEIRNLQSVLWVYLFFKSRESLMARLYEEYGCEGSKPLHFEQLARNFVKLAEERYPTVAKLMAEAHKQGLSTDEEKMITFIQYRDGVRGVSPKLYRNDKHRQDLYMILVEAINTIEEEEEVDESL